MLKDGPGNITRVSPRLRVCDDCGDYSAHMSHAGLVYRFFYDEKGGYHRHIAHCPDWKPPIRSDRVH
jgi:hypothetical protein